MNFKFASQIVKYCVGNSIKTIVFLLLAVPSFAFATDQGIVTQIGTSTFSFVSFDTMGTQPNAGVILYTITGAYPAGSQYPAVTSGSYPNKLVDITAVLGATVISDNEFTFDVASGGLGWTADGDYGLRLYSTTDSFDTAWYNINISGGVYSVNGTQPANPFTRIISINPCCNATTSTSSSQAIDITGYVAPTDYATGTTLTVYISRDSSTQQTSGLMAWESVGAPYTASFTFPITSSGDFSFSTTTDTSAFLEGRYSIAVSIDLTVETALENGGLIGLVQSGWGYFMGVLELANGSQTDQNNASNIRKVESFIIGKLTYYDEATDAVVSARNNLLVDSSICSPLSGSFEILGCLSFLILPTPAMLNQVWNNLYNNVLIHAPFGYITRFVAIATGLTQEMPVPLTYTYGSSAPTVLQGKSIEFQIWDHFGFVNTIESDSLTDPKNLWEITMPYFNMIIGLGVLGVILWDLLDIGVPAFTGSGRSSRRMTATTDSDPDQKPRVTGQTGSTRPDTLDMRQRYPRGTIDMRHR